MTGLLALATATALVAGACTSGGSSGTTSVGVTSETTTSVGSPTLLVDPPRTIPQPVVVDLTVAPESQRIDVAMPSFSDPANITNPLFPILGQESVLQLGVVDGKPFRAEVALADAAGQLRDTLAGLQPVS